MNQRISPHRTEMEGKSWERTTFCFARPWNLTGASYNSAAARWSKTDQARI